MASVNEKKDQWIQIEVCLMNRDEEKAKTAGTLTADLVHMLRVIVKVDTGCTELALNNDLVQKLNLDYVDTVLVSTPTHLNVSIDRYGPVLIYWDGMVTTAVAYCMPLLDSALLGLNPLIAFKPDFDWDKSSLRRSISSYAHKRYHINFSDIEKIIGSEDKIEYFEKEHGVKLHVTNESGCKMVLTIYALRLDVNIELVAKTVADFAPSLRPI